MTAEKAYRILRTIEPTATQSYSEIIKGQIVNRNKGLKIKIIGNNSIAGPPTRPTNA